MMEPSGRDRSTPMHDIAVAVLRAVADVDASARTFEVVRRDRHGDEMDEFHLADGRILIVKRAGPLGTESRFAVARLVASWIRERIGLVVPEYLDLPPGVAGEAVLAYWRVPCPTLAELWEDVPAEGRESVLRDWARIWRAVHRIRMRGHGRLPRAADEGGGLLDFLESDLERRLAPAIASAWPAGVDPAREALEAAAAVVGAPEPVPVLLHGDMSAYAVLCRREAERPRCVGLLDLEQSFAGPPEADFAKAEILHGPLLGAHWAGPWFETVREGYGRALDEALLGWFRVYHLLNLAHAAALGGPREAAERLTRAAAAELDAIGTGRSHRDVVFDRLAA